MFERYNLEAKLSIIFANEASQLGSPMIESEHLLLGLVHENIQLVNRFLTSEVSEGSFRSEILAQTTKRDGVATNTVDMPFTDECKRVLSFAAEEAGRMGQREVGAEHLLLGILREESCSAARMLRERGADIDRIRAGLAIAPHQSTPKRERTLRALDGILETLGDAHPQAHAKITKLKERVQQAGGQSAKDDV